MVNNLNDIDILISKFLSGEAGPDEAILLEDWKAESSENLRHYLNAEKLFFLTENEAPQTIDVAAAWEKVAPQLEEKPKAKIFRLTPAVFRMAASFLILIGIGGSIGYFLMNQGRSEQVFASAGKFKLQDGTQMQIASHSSVSVNKDFGKQNRLLKLKGSAYFTVEHNEAMPFIIDAGEVFIKDLGTKFNVVSAQDTLHVSVDEGIVSVYDRAGEQLTLKAGESAYYLRSSKELVAGAPVTELVSKQAQQVLKFDFANKKLGEVIKSLNKAYKTNIELENNALANLTITTKFENEDLDVVLSIVTETLGLKYQKTNKGYLILAAK